MEDETKANEKLNRIESNGTESFVTQIFESQHTQSGMVKSELVRVVIETRDEFRNLRFRTNEP